MDERFGKAAYDAWAAANPGMLPLPAWDSLSAIQRERWEAVAAAVLTEKDKLEEEAADILGGLCSSSNAPKGDRWRLVPVADPAPVAVDLFDWNQSLTLGEAVDAAKVRWRQRKGRVLNGEETPMPDNRDGED